MPQYVEKLFYAILPCNRVLHNLCICAMDAVFCCVLFMSLKQFQRYSVKPGRRFNAALISHCTILVLTSPLYQFYVPFKITHLQLVLFVIYIMSLIRQQVFVTSLLVVYMFMLNGDFSPVLVA